MNNILQQEIGQRLLERLEFIHLQPQLVINLRPNTDFFTQQLRQHYSAAKILAIENVNPIPLAQQSTDLIFSNLTLQEYADLSTVFAEFKRVLKPGGLLLFSIWDADTFIDMHDIGDKLVRAQLAEPVLDREELVLSYRNDPSLLSTTLQVVYGHAWGPLTPKIGMANERGEIAIPLSKINKPKNKK
jgi:malonyl-CoA O-methyltransferase